jgi:hypothetical protein
MMNVVNLCASLIPKNSGAKILKTKKKYCSYATASFMFWVQFHVSFPLEYSSKNSELHAIEIIGNILNQVRM